MKAIQIMLHEELVARLDASEEVKAEGRSAVLRRAAAEYLDRRRREAIADLYRKAYTERRQLSHNVGSLGREKMQAVCKALAIATGCS
jgi:hypothetical protein